MQTGKKKVLGLVHGDFTSHTVRVLAIAKALRDTNEYDILFSGSGPYMKFVEEAGFSWVETKTIPGDDYIRRSEENNLFGLYDKETVDYLVWVEDELQKKYKPDIIIRDFMREGAGIAAKKNHVFDVLLEQINLGPNFKFDFMPMNMEGFGTGKDIDYNRLICAMRKNISRNFHIKICELGMQPTDRTVEGVEADLILIPDSKILYGAELISDKYKYIGPVLQFGQQREPEWIEEFINSSKKKIVITSGTTGRWDRINLYEETFDLEKYSVALYTNGEKVPNGFFGGKFELNSIVKEADLFIHHGGLGSAYIGLSNAVPMISLYNDSEQQTTSVHLKKLGVAECCCARTVNAQWLKETVDSLINTPSIKERLIELSKQIDINSYRNLAVKFIKDGYEEFLKNKKSSY